MQKPIVPRLPEILVSVLLIAAILWLVDVNKIIAIFSKASIPLFLAATLVYFSASFIMSYRIKFVLRAMKEEIPYGKAFMGNAAGLLASDFTPARAGYFITPFILNLNAGTPVDKGMMAIVGPQIAEFFLKALGAAAAIFLLFYSFPALAQSSLLLWAGVAIMLLFCAVMYGALFVPAFVKQLRRLSFIPYVTFGCDFLQNLQEHRHKVMPIFLEIFAISVTVFLLKGFEWWLYGMALGVTFNVAVNPYLVFLVLQPLLSLFQFVPIPSVAGIGLSEGSAVASMALLGVSPELAVAYIFLTRIGTMLGNLVGAFELVPALSRLKDAKWKTGRMEEKTS